MDSYNYHDHYDFYDGYREFSRVDLVLLGTVFSLFAAVMIPSLGYAEGTGHLFLRLGIALLLAAGAVLSFRGALIWGKEVDPLKEPARLEQPQVDQVYDLDVFHTNSRAA